MAYTSGCQLGQILPPRVIWQHLEMLLILMMDLGVLLNTLQCTGRFPQQKYLFQNVNSIEVEKSCLTVIS